MPHCTQSLQIDYATFEPPEKTPIQPSSFSGIPYKQRCCPPTCTARCCRPTCPSRYDQACVPPSKSPSQTSITISVSTCSLNQFCRPSCETSPPQPSPPTCYHQPQFNPSLFREACCFPLTVPLPPRCYLIPPKPSSMQPVGCPPCEPCPPPCKPRPSPCEPGLPGNSSIPSCPPCPCPSPFEPGTPCNLSHPCCSPLGDSFPSPCRPSTPCNQSRPNCSSPCEPCPPPCEPCVSPCDPCKPCANGYSCPSPCSPCTMPCGPCPCSSPCSPCAMPCGPCPCSPPYLCPIPCDPCSPGEHCKCDPGTAPCGSCSCSHPYKYLSPCDICSPSNSIQPSSDSCPPPFPCEPCTTPCDPCIPPPCRPCLPRPCTASAQYKPYHLASTSGGQSCSPHGSPFVEHCSHSSSLPCIPRAPHCCDYGSPSNSLSSNEESSSLSNFWESCDAPARDPGPTICYSIPEASVPTPIQCPPPSPRKSPRMYLPPFYRPPWVNPCIANRNPYCCRTAPCTICNCIPCNCTACECDPCKTCDTECNTYSSCDVACSPCCPCDRACSPCPVSESKDEACGPSCPCQSLKDPCSPTYDIFRQECQFTNAFPKDPVKFIMVWDPADREPLSRECRCSRQTRCRGVTLDGKEVRSCHRHLSCKCDKGSGSVSPEEALNRIMKIWRLPQTGIEPIHALPLFESKCMLFSDSTSDLCIQDLDTVDKVQSCTATCSMIPMDGRNKYDPGSCCRPFCKHWQPKETPCYYDGPCKANCFNHPPGMKSRRRYIPSLPLDIPIPEIQLRPR